MSNDLNPNLAQIQKTYHLIDDNFDAVYTKSTTEEKSRLISLRDAARDAFWRAVAENLSDNHGLTTQTLGELEKTNNQIQDELKTLANVSDILDTLTQGVKLAGALVTLAAA